jgi:outer membrane protein assembly factor BamB
MLSVYNKEVLKASRGRLERANDDLEKFWFRKGVMKIRSKFVFAICAPTVFLFTIACRGRTAGWKGTVTTENGITVVQNPKQPMYGEDVLVLEEDLSIGKIRTGEEDYFFSQIRGIAVDDSGNIYVLDSKEKHVLAFDEEGRCLTTFGRAGQGPGEFNSPLTLNMTRRGEIVVEDFRSRLVYFSPEGEYTRNISMIKTGISRIVIDSSGNILGLVIMRDKENPRYELQKFDPEMNFIHALDSTPTPSASSEGFNPFRGSIYYAFDKDDRVVCGVPDRYEIKIFDTGGNLVKKIKRDYDPVEITEEEKKEVEKEMPPEIKLAIPKYHIAFQWIMTDDEGRILVMTQERLSETEGYYYDVFDPEGRYCAKIPLTFRPLVIKKNKFYSVKEDEDGFHTVRRYKAVWRMGT